jgi:LPXTG-motif cell wall-anchored protein
MSDFFQSWYFILIMLALLIVLIGVFLVVRNKKEED